MNENEKEQVRQYVLALLDAAIEIEPSVTQDLQRIVKIAGGEMVGLEDRFKSEESLMRKLEERVKERRPNLSFQLSLVKQSERINDSLRYTVVFSTEDYVESYKQFVSQLERFGYTVVRSWNDWATANTKNDQGYRGINLTLKHFQEHLFEIQFHTMESWQLKNETHPLYQELWLRSTPYFRKLELAQLQVERAAKISIPVYAEFLGEL
jgi:ppGpp synthetase/RelA/SpoT-type nucleotidyltranferase